MDGRGADEKGDPGMISHPRPRTDGFSLVEMMAAMVIFAVGVLAVLEAVTTSLRSTIASVGYTQAVFLAQQRLEEALVATPLSAAADAGDFGAAYPRHTWTREIEELEAERLYRIRVDVAWNERGRDRQFTLTTLAANRQ